MRLLLFLLAGCGRLNFDTTELATSCEFGEFSTPTIVSELSTPALEWAPSVSPNMRQIIFSRDVQGNGQDLLFSKRATVTDLWDAPQPINELATDSPDEDDPTLSADGTELIFGNVGTLFRTTRLPGGTFDPPAVLFNDAALPFVEGPELSPDELTLYFNAGVSSSSIFTAHRTTRNDPFTGFAILEPNPDPTGDAGWPTLSSDELELFFSSAHAGQRDIYRSTRATTDDPFSAGELVEQLNSSGEEYDPELSSDGTTIWLSSDRAGGSSHDIYVATRPCL